MCTMYQLLMPVHNLRILNYRFVHRFYVENGTLLYGDYAQALEADTWYTLSVIFDYANGRAYYYLNDTCFGIKEDTANISMDSQLAKVRVNATEAYDLVAGLTGIGFGFLGTVSAAKIAGMKEEEEYKLNKKNPHIKPETIDEKLAIEYSKMKKLINKKA